MNRNLIISIAVLITITACKKKKNETTSPIISSITAAVFATGHIEAKDQFTLNAMSDGYITQVLVQEGDIVLNNQLLFTQDNTAAAVQQQTATKNLRVVEQQAAASAATLQQLRAQLSTAQDKLRNDEIQLGRMQRLYTTHSVARIEVENAQLAYNNSLNNVNAMQENIKATALSLQQTLINSRGQEQTAITNNSYYQLKSPGTYKVYTILKKKGDLVRKGEAVAILGNATVLKAILSIDESSISKVRLQQKVLISLNTEKDNIYTGYLSKIYPAFDISTQAYTAEVAFDSIPSTIINGTLLQANIIISGKDKALLIPHDYLSPDNKVWVRRNRKTDTLTVQTGIVSNEWVEILSGLNTHDKIVRQF